MKFSILIPVYNVQKYLSQCIDSILTQKFDSYEIILLDDGSTDESGNICTQYGSRYPGKIKVFHQKNRGLFATRRELFNHAVGDYCLCIDSDDFINEDSLEILSQIIDEYNCDFILYDLIYFFDKNKSSKREICPLKANVKYNDLCELKKELLDQSYANWSMCNKCIKTSLAKTSFDFSKYYNISYGEDTLQTIVLFNEAANFVYCDKEIYNYRIGSGMTKKLPIKQLEDFYQITLDMKYLCSGWTENIEKACNYYFSKIYANYMTEIFKSSDNWNEVRTRIGEVKNFLSEHTDIGINYKVFDSKIKRIFLKLELYRSLYYLFYIRKIVQKS